MVKIDIIIPTCRNKEEVQSQISEIENNTTEPHRIIATCQPISAAKNRNYGLSFANSSIIIMLDDDITGFYQGWLTDFISVFNDHPDAVLTSARLLSKDRKPNNNMGMNTRHDLDYAEVHTSYTIDGVKYRRVTAAAIAFKKTNVVFDEVFKLSGYEDTSFMNDLSKSNPNGLFYVNNKCKLIHLNNMLGQGDKDIWQFNHDHYCKKYPWDTIAANQRWWGK
jgi:hypothetical protein